MVEGRFSVGPAAYDEASFLGAVSSPEPMGTLAPEGLEVLSPGEAAGPIVGGTLTQLTVAARARHGPSMSPEAAYCFSKTSASVRTACTGC